jgi:Family of unknown function (DUF6502)
MSSRNPATPVLASAIRPDSPDAASEQQALRDALAGLLSSVAQLAVARGMTYAEVDDMLKLAFVQSASKAHEGLLAHRKVSRISTTTGINRREVTRLTQDRPRAAGPARSLASEVFMLWGNQKPYRDAKGQPRVLPRQGAKPSFESLAQGVTRDVHPRSLLDELCRLGLAKWDEVADTVALSNDGFVPQGDSVRMLGFLGDNVGDHLRAAVANVLSGERPHFEQAVYADGLTSASMAFVQPALRAQWQTLLAALVPELEARVGADAALNPTPTGRLRVGMYAYQEVTTTEAAPPSESAPTPTPQRRTQRKP